MAVSVVIQALCLAQTVVQFDRFVARIQPLAILPTVSGNPKRVPFHQHLSIFQAILLVAQKPYRTP